MSAAGIAAGFSSKNPELVKTIQENEAANEAALAAWWDWVHAEFPGEDDIAITQNRAGHGGRAMSGVDWSWRRGPVPEGWRRPRQTESAIVPRKKTPEEKKRAASMGALPRVETSPDLPGMWRGLQISETSGSIMWRSTTVQYLVVGDEVWALWSMDPDRADVSVSQWEKSGAQVVDETIWTRRKLSEVIAAVEEWEEAGKVPSA